MGDKKKAKTQGTVEAKILGRLKDFAESLENSNEIPDRFTRHTVKLDLSPAPYDPERVRQARDVLHASQAIFAQFLGVSVAAVRDWEQGAKPPGGSSCRIMDEILRDPAYWRARIAELATPASR